MTEQMLSCGVVVARKTPAGWVTLVLRAFNHWDFPKGILEQGEQPLQAALREVKEETGPYSRGKVARYYLASTR